ncbi:MAG TPA: glycosyltransferase [Rhodanobacteraceae bacterium]
MERLRTLVKVAWLHWHREGILKTLIKSVQRLREVAFAAFAKPGGGASTSMDARFHMLVIDALMPDPTRDAASVRLCRIMEMLRDSGWAVDFMPDNLHADPSQRAILDALGVRTLCRPEVGSLAQWLHKHGPCLQAVLLSRYYIAWPHYDLVRRHAPTARVIFNPEDLHYLRESRELAVLGQIAPDQHARIEDIRHQELELVRKCDVTVVVSHAEKLLLQREVPKGNVQLLSTIHDVHPDPPGYPARRDLVFVGGWGHPPNRDAIHWLVDAIMPLLRELLPGIRLHLVGDMPAEVRPSLEASDVLVHGRVQDLAALLDSSRVALAPLRYGAGVKGKINSAMSRGLPVVATSIAIEGMFLAPDMNVLTADDAAGFAGQVARMYRDPVLWQSMSKAGLRNIREHFSPEVASRNLQLVLGSITDARMAEFAGSRR